MNYLDNIKETIIVGLSGGVDSAVSALLLKNQGHNVIGIYMVNWDKELNGDCLGTKYKDFNVESGCNSEKDFLDAKAIAEQLKIKLIKVNFVKEYWNLVFQNVLNEYKKNLTPNPDILCNTFIKFGILKQYVEKNYPGAYLATGHYACIERHDNQNFLSIPKDENKDQTYFLCYLKNNQLDNVIFPLANYLKSEVRKIAEKNNLVVANKKDSTGVCFIGERDFKKFLENYFPKDIGPIILLPDKKNVGFHDGLKFYTIGQRHGLNVGGMKEKTFVVKKDSTNNTLYIALESNISNYLETNYTKLVDFKFINEVWKENDLLTNHFFVRFRHRQKLIKCWIKKINKNKIEIFYPTKAISVTPGQYAAIRQ